MQPQEMKLPQIDQEVFGLEQVPEKIYKILWVIDPAVLRRLDQSILVRLTKINIQYQVQTAQLEAKMKQAEADAFEQIGKVLEMG